MLKEFPKILCLRLKEGRVQPLAWTNIELSKKIIRRNTKKFQKDEDVIGGVLVSWYRLYNTPSEAKTDLKEF